jgi:hypothetical protein
MWEKWSVLFRDLRVLPCLKALVAVLCSLKIEAVGEEPFSPFNKTEPSQQLKFWEMYFFKSSILLKL